MQDHSSVTYRDIPSCPGYRTGSDGSVWSCWRFRGAGYGGKCTQVMSDCWRKLKGCPRREDGRLRYRIRRHDGTFRHSYGSTLVLESFTGPRPKGMECCHNNGNCLDNSASNLRWDTPINNKADMLRHGTRLFGENHPRFKLTDLQVEEIIMAGRKGEPATSIHKRFNVSLARICQILKKGKR